MTMHVVFLMTFLTTNYNDQLGIARDLGFSFFFSFFFHFFQLYIASPA